MHIFKWKWKKLNTRLPKSREDLCAVMVRNKRLIIAGSTYSADVDIFDIDGNKWSSGKPRKYETMVSGIYYDEPNDVIYVGGGYDESEGDVVKYTECYDLQKDIWSQLPNTNKGHDMYPLIWLEDNNLLHIMSISSNCIECIDLREGKGWSIKNDNVSDMFNTKFKGDIDSATASRLVSN